LGEMNANEIDQPLGNERTPLMRAIEQLTHRQLCCALLPDQAEILDVFR
jgi:hypothetical protein